MVRFLNASLSYLILNNREGPVEPVNRPLKYGLVIIYKGLINWERNPIVYRRVCYGGWAKKKPCPKSRCLIFIIGWEDTGDAKIPKPLPPLTPSHHHSLPEIK
jgi:hypothetical protein